MILIIVLSEYPKDVRVIEWNADDENDKTNKRALKRMLGIKRL